jgi:hypothetical protein
MSRPLHFFGGFGALSIMAGSVLSALLLGLKIIHPSQNVMDAHAPLFVIAGVLILAGIQLLAVGLLGELQVRHFHTSQQRAPYTIDRIVRLRAPEEPSILSDRDNRF